MLYLCLREDNLSFNNKSLGVSNLYLCLMEDNLSFNNKSLGVSYNAIPMSEGGQP